ncbi:MAG TPA: CAP domain-containing protein [Terriglobales bacterium]|nr:CAP domain-containing protein [Terriglobales bacterium]
MVGRRQAAIAILVIGACSWLAAAAKVARLESIERNIFAAVTREREQRGLNPLKLNTKLGESAAGHLGWMMSKRMLSHHFEGEQDLTTRVAATGLRFNSAAENVAFATDWEDIHSGLMRSPGHRANILSPKYDEVGIAVALGQDGYYAVQNFAHTTSEDSAGDAEARLAKAIRTELKSDVAIVFDPKARQAVCEMANQDKLEARRLPAEPPLKRMFAYTASEPEEIPEPLTTAAKRAGTRQMVVGVCYKATEKYPGGTYWVGVLY